MSLLIIVEPPDSHDVCNLCDDGGEGKTPSRMNIHVDLRILQGGSCWSQLRAGLSEAPDSIGDTSLRPR